MATKIQNPSIEPTTLPYPFRGVLRGLQTIILSASVADCIAALGGSEASRALLVSESDSTGPFDDAAYGGGVTSPGDIDIPLPAGRVPYGNSAGDGLSSEAAFAYNASTNTLSVDAVATSASGSLSAGTGGIATTGDLEAAGGFKAQIPGFTATLAATQTDTNIGLVVAGLGWVAPYDGSIVSIGAMIDAAITGAGTAVTVKAAINGVALVGGPEADLTEAGGETSAYAVAAKDDHPFSAGDVITLVYDSTAITNTPDISAVLGVEI